MEEKLVRKPETEKPMRHKLWYNQAQGFAYMQLVGELGMTHIPRLFSMMNDVFRERKNRFLLIDARLSRNLLIRKEIRSSFKEKSSNLDLERVAVLVADPSSRMTLKILLSVLGKTNVSRFCTSEKEALAWLKGHSALRGSSSNSCGIFVQDKKDESRIGYE